MLPRPLDPPFQECPDCLFWNSRRLNPACRTCPAGENFEPRIRDTEPTERDLFEMVKDWSNDDVE